jgi:hypothetical protein
MVETATAGTCNGLRDDLVGRAASTSCHHAVDATVGGGGSSAGVHYGQTVTRSTPRWAAVEVVQGYTTGKQSGGSRGTHALDAAHKASLARQQALATRGS